MIEVVHVNIPCWLMVRVVGERGEAVMATPPSVHGGNLALQCPKHQHETPTTEILPEKLEP